MVKFPNTEDLLLAYSFGIIFSQCLRFWDFHLFEENEKIGLATYTHASVSFLFLVFEIFHGRILPIKLTVMENLVTFVILFAMDLVFRGTVSINNCSGSVQLLIALYSILILMKIVQKSMQHRYVRIINFSEDIYTFLEREYPTCTCNLIFIWLFEMRGFHLHDINLGHASMQLAVDRHEKYISNWPSNPLVRPNLVSEDVPSHPSPSLSDDIRAEGGNPHTIICLPENVINAINIYNWFKKLKDNEQIKYNLLSNNCTYFIRSALLKGGFELLKPWVGVSISTMSFSTDLASHVADSLAYHRGNFWIRVTYHVSFFVGFCKMILFICIYLQVMFFMLYVLFPNFIPVQRFPFYYNQS